MVSISDLSTTGRHGRPIYGTAAILRRMFSNPSNYEQEYDDEALLAECKRVIKECGYASFDD